MWGISKKAWERLREGLNPPSLLDAKAIGDCFGLNEDEINHFLEQSGFQTETECLGRWKVTGEKSEYIASYIPTKRKGSKHCNLLEITGHSEGGNPQYRPLWRRTILKDLENYL